MIENELIIPIRLLKLIESKYTNQNYILQSHTNNCFLSSCIVYFPDDEVTKLIHAGCNSNDEPTIKEIMCTEGESIPDLGESITSEEIRILINAVGFDFCKNAEWLVEDVRIQSYDNYPKFFIFTIVDELGFKICNITTIIKNNLLENWNESYITEKISEHVVK